MIGQAFQRLTVIAAAGKDKKRQLRWLCSCVCGGQAIVAGVLLRKGETRSCGCLQREAVRAKNRTHGLTGTRLYTIWANMKARCQNPNYEQFEHYGGRGIEVCAEWQAFESFAQWARANGYREDLTIDRVDNDGGYAPSNCRWATSLEQARNKRPRKDQKLSDADVSAIREDSRNRRIVAAAYGVRPTHIDRIRSGVRRSFPTERKAMKTFNSVAAQGEVNLRRIDALPEGLVPVAVEAGLLIVGHSESGHHHGFRPEVGVAVMERPAADVPQGLKVLYAILENPTALIQDATTPHEPLMVDAGIWEIRIAREFDPFAEQARQVAD